MKLSLSSSLYSRSKSTCQNLLKPFLNSTSTLNSSTIARSDSLYRRISPVGDPRDSVVPVLDQWVQEGRFLDRTQLRLIIKELKVYRRFQHALEVRSVFNLLLLIPTMTRDYVGSVVVVVHLIPNDQMGHQKNAHLGNGFGFGFGKAWSGYSVSKMSVAEIRMLSSMCGKTRRDMIRTDTVRENVGVTPIEEKLRENRLRWFGHVYCRLGDAVVKIVDKTALGSTL
ncbi:hypothetical protein RHMOL_Rhmol13G0236100 [Rhododendron molle]|uniref:Uncharacterized protein n=1 Tax=Rhododendron molle TaxID=49168 RepID=A0ACC0LA69_RHOML|nr:hypothetical protein RHMOL_Rhmol13G0236100 [Rhododendron molle]